MRDQVELIAWVERLERAYLDSLIRYRFERLERSAAVERFETAASGLYLTDALTVICVAVRAPSAAWDAWTAASAPG